MLTHVVMILDETGSMAAILEPTIEGVNEYLAGLRMQTLSPLVTLALFNGAKGVEVRYRATPAGKVAPLTVQTYRPDATTPLYDALGDTLQPYLQEGQGLRRVSSDSERVMDLLEDKEETEGIRYLGIIVTDGLENASRRWNKSQVQALLKDLEATWRWTLVYLGANQDAWAEGGALGVKSGNIQEWAATAAGTKVAYRSLFHATADYLAGGQAASADFWASPQKGGEER